jgi:hypothetical protein
VTEQALDVFAERAIKHDVAWAQPEVLVDVQRGAPKIA